LRKDNFTQWVSSRDLLTAKELITDYMAKWAGAANIVAKGLDGENAQVIDKEKGITAFIVQFDNGSRVLSLSSTPEAFAGKGGDVFIDEADLHENSKKVIDMAQPCTTWGGQLEVVSALKIDGGPNTPFCRLVDEAEHQGNPRGWNLHKTTIVDAVEQGFVEKIGEVTGKNWTRKDWLANMESQYSKEAWRTQFLLIPSEDGGALISYELINAAEAKPCAQDTLMPMKYDKFLPMYLGMDIGRKKDLSVIICLQRLGDILWTVGYEVMEKTPYRIQEAKLGSFLEMRNCYRGCIDATGKGEMLAEYAVDKFGSFRAEGIIFTNPAKARLAETLHRRFEDRRIRIPRDPIIAEDLHKIIKSTTLNNHARYEGDRDENGHSDRFWAYALANHAAESSLAGPCEMEAAGESRDPWTRSGANSRMTMRPNHDSDYANDRLEKSLRNW
jgi:phage FluMu gp28-like protein